MLRFILCLLVLGACPLAMAGGGGGGGGGLMDPHPGLAIWTIITFLVLLVVLGKFVWKPLIASLDTREKNIREAIEGAEKARQEAHKTMQDAQDKLAKASGEARAILENAHAQAARLKEEMVAETDKECSRIKSQTQTQLSQAKEKAVQEIWQHIASISVEMAGKLLRKQLDAREQKSFFEESLQEIRKKMQTP